MRQPSDTVASSRINPQARSTRNKIIPPRTSRDGRCKKERCKKAGVKIKTDGCVYAVYVFCCVASRCRVCVSTVCARSERQRANEASKVLRDCSSMSSGIVYRAPAASSSTDGNSVPIYFRGSSSNDPGVPRRVGTARTNDEQRTKTRAETISRHPVRVRD